MNTHSRAHWLQNLSLLQLFLTAIIAVAAAGPAGGQEVRMDLDTTAVRILLGVTDKVPTRWDGQVRLSTGEIIRIEPWRMRPDDWIIERSGWKATSYQLTNPPQGQPRFSPTGVVLTLKPARGAQLDVSTSQGDFRVSLDDVKPGERKFFLDGRVMVDGVAPAAQITADDAEHDFPAVNIGPDGELWLVLVRHEHGGPRALQPLERPPHEFNSLMQKGGGDQIALMRFDGKTWSGSLAISPPGLDVSRPTFEIDHAGILNIIWAQQVAGNWDLYWRPVRSLDATEALQAAVNGAGITYLKPTAHDQPKRLTRIPGSDVNPVVGSDWEGNTWVAWQAWTENGAEIQLASSRSLVRERKPLIVARGKGNSWSPDLARDFNDFRIAYDASTDGNYDIYVRTCDTVNAELSEPFAIATSSRFEARPSVVCDRQSRVWVAYEQRAADWGKDFGPLAPIPGSPLYMRGSSVQVRCVVNGKLMQPAGELMKNFPDDLKRYNSYPRLAFEGRGRLWLLFRHRHEAVWGGNPSAMMVGGVWLEYATCYDGEEWSAPVFLASSDNLLDVRPALARVGTGESARLIAIYPSDGRLRHEVIGEDHQRKIFFTGGGATVPGQAKNDLFAAILPDLGPVKPMKLVPADATKPGPAGIASDSPGARGQGLLDPDPESKAIHPNFADDLKRIREYRVEAGGKKYQLLRGEFHRHTELSMDGGEDGSLEDMWRYAIDAAQLDWIGNGDHDSGGGREYPWWIIQKTTDIYNHPPYFVGMFTYERSVPYPNGHRNCMFDRRGIRTLPRLIGDEPGGVSPDDTKMLYRYLKEMGGICASHTSGTGMGTDWRDNDPTAEPIVEIYQGDRNSYEALGGPRVARKQGEAIGGWKPLGMIWNAMAMGHKFGFQSSSDHWSTHISYAIAIAEEPNRTAILDAFKKRHCYGATDNIILDVRMGDAIMGDEVTFKRGDKREPKLSVRIIGTAPLARVDVIKDFGFVYSTESKDPTLQFDWTDPDPRPGLSWYYVRVVQSDGQVAWGSPIWVQIPVNR